MKVWLAAWLLVISIDCTASLRIFSLDFCADQYVMALAPKGSTLVLSPDAHRSFSYLRAQAKSHTQQSPRLEYILRFKPDLVVRFYGGGVQIASRLERLGIPLLQLHSNNQFEQVEQNILLVSSALGTPNQGQALIETMNQHLGAITQQNPAPTALYMTASGAVAGRDTFIQTLFELAGVDNYIDRVGWSTLPLEKLAQHKPDQLALAFKDDQQYVWSSARHPLIQQYLADLPSTSLSDATVACPAWYSTEAIADLSKTAQQYAQ